MTQKATLAMLLLKYGRVTLRMMAENGILYTGRNRVCDLKRDGWQIVHYNHDPLKGETVSDNAYILQSAPERFRNIVMGMDFADNGIDRTVDYIVDENGQARFL